MILNKRCLYQMGLKQGVANRLVRIPSFRPMHMGQYIRRLYFWREVKKLPVQHFKRVLDAGCGSGEYAVEFAKWFPGVDVRGIDIRLPRPRQPLPANCQLYQGDLLNMREHQKYDFIWSIDVLEHIAGNERVLENLAEALRYGGFLYLHIPYDNPGKRVFPENWFANFNKWAEEEHIGEQRPLAEWVAISKKNGLEEISAAWTFGFWGELSWEIDRLTDQRPNMKVLLAPALKAMGHAALVFSGSQKRGNVLIVARKVPAKGREDSPEL